MQPGPSAADTVLISGKSALPQITSSIAISTLTPPNEKWVTDISEFQIPAGKVYLSPMIDCFDGMVVSWTIGTSPDAELVNTMLDAAIETVTEDDQTPLVHSDRGGHYRWPGWLSRVAKANLFRSMSRKASLRSCVVLETVGYLQVVVPPEVQIFNGNPAMAVLGAVFAAQQTRFNE
jgi:hypothetical protein